MPVQRSRFHTAVNSPPNRQVRTEIVEPTGGLNRQRPATNLRPGETPFSQNWVMGDRYIEPRSGLSSWGTTGITGTVLGYASAPNSANSEFGYIFSSATHQLYATNIATPRWIPQGAVGLGSPGFSSATADYFSTAYALRPNSSATSGPNSLYLTNWKLTPKVLSVGQYNPGSGIVNLLSDLTEAYSLLSYAKYVASHDDRLLFFHSGTTTVVSSTGTADFSAFKPTRIVGSARGNTHDFSNGFFEDIVGMQGVGTGMVPEKDRLLLLSEKQTWVGRPRRDAFAYDFFAIEQGVGMPAQFDRTPKNTEAGTLWLGDGFQFYRAVGDQVRAVGDKVRDLLRDEMREWRHCFTVYNPSEHIYGVFYSDTTGEYATKALFLRTDTITPVAGSRDDGIWFQQDFGSLQFNAGGVYGTEIALVSSAGSPYRLRSTQTTDNGTAIDCRWRSHALRAERDIFPFEALQEAWLEYEYDGTQTSTISLFQSGNNGASFTPVAASSLTTGTGYNHIPTGDTAAARNQMFEVRLNDGSKPRLARFSLALRGYSGRHSGTL